MWALSIICKIIEYRKINHQSYISRYVEISLPNDHQCDTQCQLHWVNEPLILFYFTLCLNTYTAKIPYAICVYAFNTYAERITANELYARIPIASELNAQIQDSRWFLCDKRKITWPKNCALLLFLSSMKELAKW